MPDPRLKTHAPEAVRHLISAGKAVGSRQVVSGGNRGNVPPWLGADDVDFHGTLSAIWIWARHQRLSGAPRFEDAREMAWNFVDSAAPGFIPHAIDATASDEAAYDCAMMLVAGTAERALGELPAAREALVDRAARVLSTYLTGLEDLSGREFKDPGFLAYALLEHAQATGDRGLQAGGRKLVERAFGMKPPGSFSSEPAPSGGLFDFSSTTATRVLAVMAAEGNTPFVGAWLRERVAAGAPTGFIARKLDENTWNACVAWALGRAYVVSTDRRLLESYSEVMDEIEHRDTDHDGAIGRDRTVRVPETAATFYYARAVDALVTPESANAAAAEAGSGGGA